MPGCEGICKFNFKIDTNTLCFSNVKLIFALFPEFEARLVFTWSQLRIEIEGSNKWLCHFQLTRALFIF